MSARLMEDWTSLLNCMPSIFLDAPFMKVVSEKRDELERQAKQELDGDDEPYVPEREAIMALLNEDAQDRVQRRRDRRWDR
jgi:hypothetical protein